MPKLNYNVCLLTTISATALGLFLYWKMTSRTVKSVENEKEKADIVPIQNRQITIIDTHAHLSDDTFRDKKYLNQVISDSKTVGIVAICCVSENIQTSETSLNLHKSHPKYIYPLAGLHPGKVSNLLNEEDVIKELNKICSFIESNHNELIGIGEIGLDFLPSVIDKQGERGRQKRGENNIESKTKIPSVSDYKTWQRRVFSAQLELAAKYGLPVSIHSRSAGRPVIDVIISFLKREETPEFKVVLHAFDGNTKIAQRILSNGKDNVYFSVPPSWIHDESRKSLIGIIPIENLLLETDSPVLGPTRGVTNTPSNITYSLQLIAEIKKMNVKECADIIFKNTLTVFTKLSHFTNN